MAGTYLGGSTLISKRKKRKPWQPHILKRKKVKTPTPEEKRRRSEASKKAAQTRMLNKAARDLAASRHRRSNQPHRRFQRD